MTKLVRAKKNRRHEVQLDRVYQSRARRLVKEENVTRAKPVPYLCEGDNGVLLVAETTPVDPARFLCL